MAQPLVALSDELRNFKALYSMCRSTSDTLWRKREESREPGDSWKY